MSAYQFSVKYGCSIDKAKRALTVAKGDDVAARDYLWTKLRLR